MRWSLTFARWSLLLLISQASFTQSPGKNPDYSEIFGTDYEWALQTVNKNQWWSDTLANDQFDPDFATAIIFPELIRYSSIRDYLEVKALEVLYVQYGKDYADFSIGLFQMKPSFTERIEADILAYALTDTFPSLSGLNPTLESTVEKRKARITRMKDERFQLLYLEAFIMIMDIHYQGLINTPPAEKLPFYSTAYNTGYFKKGSEIYSEMGIKRFYRGIDQSSGRYSWADISRSYYDFVKGKGSN